VSIVKTHEKEVAPLPTTLNIGDIVAIRVWSTFENQAAVNTYNCRVTGKTGLGITDQDLAGSMDLFMSAFYPTILNNLAVYNGVQVYILNRIGPQPAAVFDNTDAGPGTGSSPAAAKGTAFVLAYTSTVRGPGGRGRLYLPFLAAAAFDNDGQPIAGAATLINAFFAAMATTFIIGTAPNQINLDWVIYHRASRTYDFIVGGGLRKTVSNLHKRGDYGKPNVSPI
jgi:hypothetical protein